MLGLLLCAGRVTLNVYRIIEVENMLHSPKASSAKASSAEGHLSWNVRVIFVLVGLLSPLLC